MDAQECWQMFTCTGNILRYLDYRQQAQLQSSSAEDVNDGHLGDNGAGTEGDSL